MDNTVLAPLLKQLRSITNNGKKLSDQLNYGENEGLYKTVIVNGQELEIHNDWNYQISGVLEDFECLNLAINNIETQLENVLNINAMK